MAAVKIASDSEPSGSGIPQERTIMAESITRIVLWLFVIDLGIAFGAGLYEGRIVVPQWLSSAGVLSTSGTRRLRDRPMWA